VPQSIPAGLTREHVLKVLADLDAGTSHPFGQPTRGHDGGGGALTHAIRLAKAALEEVKAGNRGRR
jgi:hypothetical protein